MTVMLFMQLEVMLYGLSMMYASKSKMYMTTVMLDTRDKTS